MIEELGGSHGFWGKGAGDQSSPTESKSVKRGFSKISCQLPDYEGVGRMIGILQSLVALCQPIKITFL